MSSGITYPIEARTMGLREYLERCWALCSREHSVGSPLPESVQEEPCYAKRLVEATEEFARTKAMTLRDAKAELANAGAKSEEFWRGYREQKETIRNRYDALIRSVVEWAPSPEVNGFKAMALRHAEESRAFDCPLETSDNAAPMTAQEWLADRLATAERRLNTARDDLARHRENVRCANAVLVAIRAVDL